MKLPNAKYTSIALLALATALPGAVLAGQFTVNTADDPAVANPGNCLTGTQACSLRDAMAAADQVAGHDSIVFDIDDPIYLTRKLVANTPVSIDGGKNTEIRIHQGYQIVNLPDIFTAQVLPTLQPTFYGKNGFGKVMLELLGDGSEVMNLLLDGSIVPPDGEQPVERIDFDSDGTTDFVLHTSTYEGQLHWLVTGGILAYFDGEVVCPFETSFDDVVTSGSVTITDNQLWNMDNSAIKVDFYSDILIAGNEISGGGVGQPGAAAEGIELYCGAEAVVSDNTITQFRNGISFSAVSAATVTGNETFANRTGIAMETPYSWDGFHLIEDNTAEANGQFGILLLGLTDSNIARNTVAENGAHPVFEGGLLLAGSVGNTLSMNDTSHNSGFGMVLDRSYFNVLSDNKSKNNGGGGVIIVNDTQFNQFLSNDSRQNGSGFVLTLTEAGQPFPSNNYFEDNESHNNREYDVRDDDPACNDAWAGNQFKTVASATPGCIN